MSACESEVGNRALHLCRARLSILASQALVLDCVAMVLICASYPLGRHLKTEGHRS